MTIKCTYKDCFKHFDSDAAMIKHKKKDPEHAYCHKCNVDCEDDMSFMIHQIESSKHICCPVCGMEFKSTGGRDRHVEINHASEQRIACQGCRIVFTRASNLMRHIELNECKVITLKDFQRERAERAIEKDAWTEALDKRGGSTINGSAVTSQPESEVNEEGGVSLLDSSRPGVEQDWQGNPIEPSRTGPYKAPLPLPGGHSITALSKFPALPTQSTKSTASTTKPMGDLLDINEADDRMSKLSVNPKSAWSKSPNQSKSLFPQAKPAFPKDTDDGASALSEVPFDPSGASVLSATSQISRQAAPQRTLFGLENIPPSAPAVSRDRIAADARITTSPPVDRHTRLQLDNYWDLIRECYICPAQSCNRPFPTPEAFHAHLLSGAHVGGHVTCPSCLNRFRTNAALIAHMESAGKGCNVRNSINYNQVLREVSAGLLGTSGHMEDGTVKYVAARDEGW